MVRRIDGKLPVPKSSGRFFSLLKDKSIFDKAELAGSSGNAVRALLLALKTTKDFKPLKEGIEVNLL